MVLFLFLWLGHEVEKERSSRASTPTPSTSKAKQKGGYFLMILPAFFHIIKLLMGYVSYPPGLVLLCFRVIFLLPFYFYFVVISGFT